MSNYRYCAESKICVRNFQACSNSTLTKTPGVPQAQYTRDTGCPVTKKCKISVDGNFFIDSALRSEGGLDTSLDGQIKFDDMSLQKVKSDASSFPCAMVFYNLPKKELTMQVSGPNVGVQLMRLNYPKTIVKESLNPFNQYSQFTIMPENDMVIMYLGSTASATSTEAGPATIKWINKKVTPQYIDLLGGKILKF